MVEIPSLSECYVSYVLEDGPKKCSVIATIEVRIDSPTGPLLDPSFYTVSWPDLGVEGNPQLLDVENTEVLYAFNVQISDKVTTLVRSKVTTAIRYKMTTLIRSKLTT